MRLTPAWDRSVLLVTYDNIIALLHPIRSAGRPLDGECFHSHCSHFSIDSSFHWPHFSSLHTLFFIMNFSFLPNSFYLPCSLKLIKKHELPGTVLSASLHPTEETVVWGGHDGVVHVLEGPAWENKGIAVWSLSRMNVYQLHAFVHVHSLLYAYVNIYSHA